MTSDDKTRAVLVLARSVIRDQDHDWPANELVMPPREVCAMITEVLGDEYNYETGDDKLVKI